MTFDSLFVSYCFIEGFSLCLTIREDARCTLRDDEEKKRNNRETIDSL